MAKRKGKPAVVEHVRLVFGGIVLNGEKITADLDYERTVYADGTVEERGRPDGWPANLTPAQIIQRHFLAGGGS